MANTTKKELLLRMTKAVEEAMRGKTGATAAVGAAISAGMSYLVDKFEGELSQRDDRLRAQASRIAALERKLGINDE